MPINIEVFLPTKVAVVTGAEDGLGHESAKFLLRNGVTVYALCHDLHKGPIAVKSLNSLNYKGKAIYLHCDMGNLVSIQEATKQILLKENRIHTLFANLGSSRFLTFGIDSSTKSGGGNVGLYYLLHLLRAALISAALQLEKNSVRVILMSTSALNETKETHVWRAHPDHPSSQLSSDMEGFGQHELSFLDDTPSVASSLTESGVQIAFFHLGSLRTDMFGYLPLYQRVILNKLLMPIYFGSIDKINEEVAEVNALSGTYFTQWTPEPAHTTPEAVFTSIDISPLLNKPEFQPSMGISVEDSSFIGILE